MKMILKIVKIIGYSFGRGLTFQTVLWARAYLSHAFSEFTSWPRVLFLHTAPPPSEQGQFAGGPNLCQDMPREAWIVWALLSGILVYVLTLPLRKHEAKRQTSLPNLTALPRWLCVLLPVGCGFLRVAPSGCFPFFPRAAHKTFVENSWPLLYISTSSRKTLWLFACSL